MTDGTLTYVIQSIRKVEIQVCVGKTWGALVTKSASTVSPAVTGQHECAVSIFWVLPAEAEAHAFLFFFGGAVAVGVRRYLLVAVAAALKHESLLKPERFFLFVFFLPAHKGCKTQTRTLCLQTQRAARREWCRCVLKIYSTKVPGRDDSVISFLRLFAPAKWCPRKSNIVITSSFFPVSPWETSLKPLPCRGFQGSC